MLAGGRLRERRRGERSGVEGSARMSMLFPEGPKLVPPPGQPVAEDPPDEPRTAEDSEPPPEPREDATAPTAPRGELLIEMGAVLALSYFVWLYVALLPAEGGDVETVTFLEDTITRIVYSLQVVLPLLYILARSGEPWSRFGLVRPWWVNDTMIGLVIFLAVIFLPEAILNLLYPGWIRAMEHEIQGDPFPLPMGAGETALLVVGLLVGAFAEELVFRGHLIPRLRQLGAGVVPAVLVSSVLFASIHLYQGFWSTGLCFVEGIVFGALFLAAGRLWPVVIAHTLFNLNVYDWADASPELVARGLSQL